MKSNHYGKNLLKKIPMIIKSISAQEFYTIRWEIKKNVKNLLPMLLYNFNMIFTLIKQCIIHQRKKEIMKLLILLIEFKKPLKKFSGFTTYMDNFQLINMILKTEKNISVNPFYSTNKIIITLKKITMKEQSNIKILNMLFLSNQNVQKLNFQMIIPPFLIVIGTKMLKFYQILLLILITNKNFTNSISNNHKLPK